MKTVVPTRKRTGPGSESFVTMTYCGPMLTLWGQHDAFLPPETNIEVCVCVSVGVSVRACVRSRARVCV